MSNIISEARKQVVPTKETRAKKKEITKLVTQLVKKQIVDNKDVIEVEVGGSIAKGTWLVQNADIDLFIKFKEDVPDKQFRLSSIEIGLKALEKYKPYTRYSEHPYVEAIVQGTKVNVVPCYNVKEGNWKSAADRSQFHTKFMQKNLDAKKQNETRILKQFLRANDIYGAEISKQGFSGYISEVLIWNYHTFKKVLEKFAKIQEGEIIGEAAKKFDTIITISDPIDSNRNLAAAVSNENLAKFVLVARAFLKKPTSSFFQIKKSKKRGRVSKEILKQIITIEFTHTKKSPDTIWGQIKRASDSIAAQLSVAGFTVIRNSAISDEKNHACLVFLFESRNITKKQVREGPQVFRADDLDKFITKNLSKTELLWINKSTKVMSLETREFSDAKEFLNNLLTKKLSRSGIPRDLRDNVKKGFVVKVGNIHYKQPMQKILEIVTTDEKTFSAYK